LRYILLIRGIVVLLTRKPDLFMKTCRHCGSVNDDDGSQCRKCGQALGESLPAGPAPPADATLRWTGTAMPVKSLRRSISLSSLLGGKDCLLIGRAPECAICLPHPTVSRHHALITWEGGRARLEDLASLNGVLVNGRRSSGPVFIEKDEHVGIGPFLLRYTAGEVHILDSSRSMRLEAWNLDKLVVQADGQKRKILDDVNLAIEPGEFVSLLGPSGSGKSTLMDCLNGRRPADSGQVLANGESFYLHFDSFRQSLGYVPQKDIVHTQLPVYRALYYTARLRLPGDTTPAEFQGRIDDVVRQMELEAHQGTLIGQLSGGQIKRVSLGAELLARPCLLYIDEATSGLDAGTEARMMRLFRQLADEGKSVLCITHNVDNVDLCHLILVLARGKLVYFGPPAEARPYFGVSRISEIYDALTARDPADWEKQFQASSLHEEFVAKRRNEGRGARDEGRGPREAADASPQPSPLSSRPSPLTSHHSLMVPPPPARKRFPFWHQFWVLTLRYLELIGRDRYTLRLLFLQAPIVALFILCGFAHKPYAEKILVPRKLEEAERQVLRGIGEVGQAISKEFEKRGKKLEGKAARFIELLPQIAETQGPVFPEHIIVNPRFTYMLLFLMVIIVLWFGCNNAAKEIVKESAIYSRERAVNLGIVPYLASKFFVMSTVTALQALLLMASIYGAMAFLHWQFGFDIPYPGYRLSYLEEFGVLVLLSMTGVALGLLLSAMVASPDQANTLLPYVLIPQIILGGGILQVKDGPLYYLAVALSPAYWAYRGVHRGTTALPPDVPVAMNYNDNVWVASTALILQMAILLGLAAWFLRAKDVRKR
jgi:ABC-type multidrug transport system ATPase subunit